jgi:O-antigen/teichoic acid export membrane protein
MNNTEHSILARIFKNFGAQLISLGLSALERFVTAGLLIRAWGADAYSDWLVVGSTAGLIGLTELGVSVYFGNIWQKAFAAGDSALFQRTLSLAVATLIGFGVVLALTIGAALGPFSLASTLELHTMPLGTATLVLLLLSSAVVSRIMRGCLSQIYRGRGMYAAGTVIDQMFTASVLVATIAVALSGAGPLAVATATVLCDILFGWLFVMWNLRTRFPELHLYPVLAERAEVEDLLAKVKWFALWQGASALWLNLPMVVMNQFGIAGSSVVGFVLVRTLVNMGRQIGTMLSLAAAVELAGSLHAGAERRALAHAQQVGQLLSATSAVSAIAILEFGRPFVSVWSGRPGMFEPGVAAWMVGASLVLAPAVPLSFLHMLANRPRTPALANMAQVAVGLPAMVGLSIPFGIVGATAGLAIGEAVGAVALVSALCAPSLGGNYLGYLANCAASTLKAAFWAGAVALALRALYEPQGSIGLFLAGGLWMILGAVPALFVAMPQAERLKGLARVRFLALRF